MTNVRAIRYHNNTGRFQAGRQKGPNSAEEGRGQRQPHNNGCGCASHRGCESHVSRGLTITIRGLAGCRSASSGSLSSFASSGSLSNSVSFEQFLSSMTFHYLLISL